VTFTADLGQGEELEAARPKALQFGIAPENIYIDDLREEFVRDFVFPMFRANTVYEGEYLLGTSIARPLIAKRMIEIANLTGAEAVAHGATGKGNDQVRFELGAYALRPTSGSSRRGASGICCRARNCWPMPSARHPGRDEAPAGRFAVFDGRQPAAHQLRRPPPRRSGSRSRGIDVALDGVAGSGARRSRVPRSRIREGRPGGDQRPRMPADALLALLNQLGGKHGIGRIDLVENRYVGMKSRGCYETPGGTILLPAHRAIESITLDREVAHLKDDLMPRYASLIYNGYWWSPERLALQTLIDHTQQSVNGWVRVKLYKGNVIVVGRDSKTDSLFDSTIATFEDDAGAYDQKDAGGFIKLNALRMRIAANLASRKR
jgi:argininosuccinate synthase